MAESQELRERWRLSLKSELLIEKLHGRELIDVKAQLVGRFERLVRQAVEMTDECLCQIYLNSLADLYDPHSAYLGPTLLATFNRTVTLKAFRLGIGVEQRDRHLIVTYIHPSLQPSNEQDQFIGWCLLAIGRVDGPTIDLAEMDYQDYLDIIRNIDGPLEFDTEVILELMNLASRERVTMSWIRYLGS